VEVSLAVERDTAVLSVRDWGSGIDPAIRDRIFEPYFTTKAVGEGTGLGLSIVCGLVQRWGGEIDCADAPERGTVFHIRLPLVVRNLTAPVPAAD
jgi:two-component system NtrC family sensor kinase